MVHTTLEIVWTGMATMPWPMQMPVLFLQFKASAYKVLIAHSDEVVPEHTHAHISRVTHDWAVTKQRKNWHDSRIEIIPFRFPSRASLGRCVRVAMTSVWKFKFNSKTNVVEWRTRSHGRLMMATGMKCYEMHIYTFDVQIEYGTGSR